MQVIKLKYIMTEISLKLLKTSFVERGLDDQDFYCIAEASTWTFLNYSDEG